MLNLQKLQPMMSRQLHLPDNQAVRLLLIFFSFTFIHIVISVPPFFTWQGDWSWWVTLTAYALRLNLWVIIPLLFFPKEKTFRFLLVMCVLNIPTILSDKGYIDKYDGLWIYLRVICILFMLSLMLKRLNELRKKDIDN
jgi:hypothetical protein